MTRNDKKLKSALDELLTNPLPMREILLRLGVAKTDRMQMKRRLRALAEAGEIVRIKGNRYGLPEKMNLITGSVQGHRDGYGFIIPDDPAQQDVFVGPRNFNEAMHGDHVVCRIELTRSDGRREGSVIRILERAHKTVAGRFEAARGGAYVIAFDTRITQSFFIPPGETMDADDGQAVIARISDYPSRTRQPQASVVEVLGDVNDPDVEIRIVTAKYQLRSEFPAAVAREARSISAPDAKTYRGRLDLRNRAIVTIDGETAKDFDDAVEVERTDGGWRLGVHIADVANYVKDGSALDREAYRRGVSVYFPGVVIPMLPFALSNDVCSLNPKVDRLTLSCIMTLNKHGAVIDYEIRESVIRPVERMTYTAVAAILEQNDRAMIGRYGGLVQMFRDMEDLAALLQTRRASGGAIDFDLPEPEVILDITGRPENIIRAERNVAHRIIEEFMLQANRTVAEHLVGRAAPALHRVHEKPDPFKMEAFKELVSAFGFRFKRGDTLTPRKLQNILRSVAGGPEEKLVTHVMLRSMKQARYSPESAGHFALAFTHYTHFTSPIRRYPDLVVHRALKRMIHGRKFSDGWKERLPEIAEHCSAAERAAEEAERDIIKLKQTQYMARHVGDTFDGIISGVTTFGIFVELDEPAVEGLVRLTSLHDDYYRHNETDHSLTGERTGKRFRLGDLVRISVVNVSIERRQIDFELARADKTGRGAVTKRRGAGKRTRVKRARRKKGK